MSYPGNEPSSQNEEEKKSGCGWYWLLFTIFVGLVIDSLTDGHPILALLMIIDHFFP
jgi:hypothetical protein